MFFFARVTIVRVLGSVSFTTHAAVLFIIVYANVVVIVVVMFAIKQQILIEPGSVVDAPVVVELDGLQRAIHVEASQQLQLQIYAADASVDFLSRCGVVVLVPLLDLSLNALLFFLHNQ